MIVREDHFRLQRRVDPTGQQQRDDRGNQSSHFHWMYVLLSRPDPYPSGRQSGIASGYPIVNFPKAIRCIHQ